MEAGHFLPRFKQAFNLHQPSPAAANTGSAHEVPTSPIDLLIQVSTHYNTLLEAERDKGRMGNNLSPREVAKVIRLGYETLSLPAMEGLDRWARWRESDEKALLKRVARVVVADTGKLLRGG